MVCGEGREEGGEQAEGEGRGEDGCPCWWDLGDRKQVDMEGPAGADLAVGCDRFEQVLQSHPGRKRAVEDCAIPVQGPDLCPGQVSELGLRSVVFTHL